MSSLIQRARIPKQTTIFSPAASDAEGRAEPIEVSRSLILAQAKTKKLWWQCAPDLAPVPHIGQPGSELRRWHWFHLTGNRFPFISKTGAYQLSRLLGCRGVWRVSVPGRFIGHHSRAFTWSNNVSHRNPGICEHGLILRSVEQCFLVTL